MNRYFELPKCSRCDVTLEAKMYIEEEEILLSHHWEKTGRIRQNVDYLFCPFCGNKECVDCETFAGNWRYK